jgi:glycerol-3-phosphate acyltransferase PlsX
VAVCDGFVGNAVLKTTESVAKMMGAWMKRHFTSNLVRRCGVLMLSGAVRELRAKMDPDGYGGAPLLGVNGICIKTHGASRSTAVFHAIRVATESVHHHLNAQIAEDIAKVGAEA